ncbi:unnamed protein product, partial [Allacma fusca]
PDLKFFVFGINSAITTENPPQNNYNLVNIAILDGQITCEDFRFLGYTFWQNLAPTFELRSHLRDYDHQGELALPTPCYEDDLLRINGPLLTVPWKVDQSPWEILIVQNYRERNSTQDQSVLILRNHHALMDGYSIVGLWEAFSGRDRIPLQSMQSEGGVLRKLLALVKAPFDVANTLINSLDGQSCIQVNDRRRFFVTTSSPDILVSSIKRIRSKFNVKYSAVLFAAFTGAFVRALNEAGKEVPDELASYMAGPKPKHPGGASNHM